MWQSLADNITQPIAVFTSKEPVKGKTPNYSFDFISETI